MSWFEAWTGLQLLDPWLLLLALLLPAAALIRRWRGAPAVLFAPLPLLQPEAGQPPVPASWRVRLLPLPRTLQVLGLLLVVVALARPVHRSPLPPLTAGIDVLLCVDVSSSMAATDLDPARSRLAVVKAAAHDFIAQRPDDRIGLITFARFSDLRCPPTLDHAALGQLLAQIELVGQDSPEDATGIGGAVARAAEVLRTSPAPSRVIVLLTDGEENVATAQTPEEIAPLHAAQQCERLGVRVYAIAAGIGTRLPDGSFAPVDTRQLRVLAQRTGGRFFTARDAGAVAGVYAAVHQLERSDFAEPRYRLEDGFAPFLLAALLLLLGGHLLASTLLAGMP